MAIIEKHCKTKGVRYTVRFQDPLGAWYESRTFSNERDAQRYERELKQRKDMGKPAQRQELRSITLQAYWEAWARECRANVSDGWKMTQDQMWADYIQSHLGQLRITAISSQHIRRLLNKLGEDGFEAQTQLHVYNLLHKMFEDALDHDPPLVDLNPVRKKLKPRVIERERSFLPPGDARRLLEASKADPLGTVVWIALLTGLRSEAIMALRAGRVDFANRQILICECYKRKEREIRPYPKGRKWDYVPMPEMLVNFLRPKLAGKRSEDFVVNGRRNEMLSYNALLDGVKRLCGEAGVAIVTPHELRHSATELWYEMGASEEDLRRLLNQKSSSTTRRYIHRTDERLKNLARAVGQGHPVPPVPTSSTTAAVPEVTPPVPDPSMAKVIPLRVVR